MMVQGIPSLCSGSRSSKSRHCSIMRMRWSSQISSRGLNVCCSWRRRSTVDRPVAGELWEIAETETHIDRLGRSRRGSMRKRHGRIHTRMSGEVSDLVSVGCRRRCIEGRLHRLAQSIRTRRERSRLMSRRMGRNTPGIFEIRSRSTNLAQDARFRRRIRRRGCRRQMRLAIRYNSRTARTNTRLRRHGLSLVTVVFSRLASGVITVWANRRRLGHLTREELVLVIRRVVGWPVTGGRWLLGNGHRVVGIWRADSGRVDVRFGSRSSSFFSVAVSVPKRQTYISFV